MTHKQKVTTWDTNNTLDISVATLDTHSNTYCKATNTLIRQVMGDINKEIKEDHNLDLFLCGLLCI